MLALVLIFDSCIHSGDYDHQAPVKEGAWSTLVTPLQGTALYSTFAYDPLVLTIDHDQDGQYDTSHPVEDVYPGEGGPQFDVTYTLLEN